MISVFIVITVYYGNYVTGGEKPKTYGRFLGTIFANTFERRKGLWGKGLRVEWGSKSEKRQDTGDFGRVEKAEFLLREANNKKQQFASQKINDPNGIPTSNASIDIN